jgi:hypothetical protein
MWTVSLGKCVLFAALDDVDAAFLTVRDAVAKLVTEPETEPWVSASASSRTPTGSS